MNHVSHESSVLSHAAQIQQPRFEVGDIVEINDEAGGVYEVRATDGEMAWLFSPIEGFESVEFAGLKRADQSRRSAE
jgi:hypothetical protein